jgi:ring-1,2-phenylacetyl-CoA epoxidase subunit PaaC
MTTELTPEDRTDRSDNPYDLLASLDGDDRWAFGTGFADPLAGLDHTVPAGLDHAAVARYCLGLGDDALILSHRLQEWLTRLPELEEETAVANIALDLLGQARLLLTRAGAILGRDEDDLAFRRTAEEFRNVRLVEPADTDFAALMARLLVFASWRLALFQDLAGGPDPGLAAIAAKGAVELTYHREHAASWVVRLGDGTPLSHQRMQAGLDAVWPFVDELFASDPDAVGAADRQWVDAALDAVFSAATLRRPTTPPLGEQPPRTAHTDALADVLAELQSVAHQLPGATW